MASASSRSGWNTGRPRSSARRLTALAAGCMPRPAGRSGCVRTRETWYPACSRRASACAAKSGVPAKTRRRKTTLRRLAQLLGELGADALLLELREMLDEYLALQVIHLVLDADRQQPLGFQRERLAVLVVGAHFHALGTLHELVDTGHRKTVFLDVGLASRFDNLRIDQHYQRVVALGDVDDDHPLVHVDLSRREADPRRRVHGFRQVGDELLQAFVEDGD